MTTWVDSKWNNAGDVSDGGLWTSFGTTAVVDSPVVSAPHALRCTGPGENYVYHDFLPIGGVRVPLYMRNYVYFENWGSLAVGHFKGVNYLFSNTNAQCMLSIMNDGGTIKWAHWDNAIGLAPYNTIEPPQLGRYYFVEQMMNVATNPTTYSQWVEGIHLVDGSIIPSDFVRYAITGGCLVFSDDVTVVIDDVLVSDHYNGSIPPAVVPVTKVVEDVTTSEGSGSETTRVRTLRHITSLQPSITG